MAEFQLFISPEGLVIKDPVTREEVSWDNLSTAYIEVLEGLAEAEMID